MRFFPKSAKQFRALLLFVTFSLVNVSSVFASNTLATPPFSQNWTNAALITVSDDWSGVPSMIGYRGDDLITAVAADPQTVIAGDDTSPVVDVNANQTNPNTYTTGGIAEFDTLTDHTVALQGSATADAPYLKIFLNTTGMNNIQLSYIVRDIDGSTDNAIQPVALHYRVGSSGNFTNLAAGFVADATTGPSLATQTTSVNVTLPAAVENQSHVELRIMTTNATGNDEWVGIDSISITANIAPTGFSLNPTSILENQPVGTTVGTLTASDTVGDTHIFSLVNSNSCAGNGAENLNFSLVGNTLKSAAVFDYESKTSYTLCITTTDNHGLSYTGEVIVNILDIADETPPSVSVEQASAQPDPTNSTPIHFTVTFSESIIGFDASDVILASTAGNVTATVTEVAPNNGTTFDIAVTGMTMDGVVSATVHAGAATDATGNKNDLSISTDNKVTFSTDIVSPKVITTNPADQSVLLTSPAQIQVEFNEDLKHDSSANAADNLTNYLLVAAGANTVFDTISCSAGRQLDDVLIPINTAAYSNNTGTGPFSVALNINGGNSMTAGIYRLFICGSTSIEDLLGNKLNGGSDTAVTFTISNVQGVSILNSEKENKTILPLTGFPPGQWTPLPEQPLEKSYASYSDLWLEIPALAVSTPIVGVPLSEDGWDVIWLAENAGWLNGTAFPTWNGNSVLTAHVTLASGLPGPFTKLKSLHYSDYIKVHAFGQVYVYEVRQSKRIAPGNFNAALKHEEKPWLTLLTCEDYRLLFKSYTYRRMVRAVLVDVLPEE